MIGPGAGLECGDDLFLVGRTGTLQRIGVELDRVVAAIDLEGEQGALVGRALAQIGRFGVARVEPVVEVHHVLGHIRLLLHQLVVEAAAQHAEHGRQIHLLLMQGTGQQHILILVVAHDHHVGAQAANAQGHVGEVARGVGVLDDLGHLDADAGQLASQQLGRAGTELRLLMHQNRLLGHAAGGLVDLTETLDGVVDALAKARGQAEDVLQATVDDVVRHAHVNEEGRVVLGRGLRCRQGDRAGEAAHIGGHAVLVQTLDFRDANLWARLRVTQGRLEAGAAHGPDATGRVDLFDGQLAAQTTLAAAVGQATADRVHQTDFDRPGLSQQEAGRAQRGSGRTGLQNQTTRHAGLRRHG